MTIHLLPLGHGRFELYGEPADLDDHELDHDAGRIRRWLHKAGDKWRSLVDAARLGDAPGALGRWRDGVICRLADSIEEQRTMWSLRHLANATVLHPAGFDEAGARGAVDGLLVSARSHHLRWFLVDLALFVASGILFFVPGPNIVAYYLGFRAYGHLQSWRGARHALTALSWSYVVSDELTELEALVGRSHTDRARRVEAIATRLGLPRLPAFFQRAAA